MIRKMKRQKQLLGHKPDVGVWGDCYRTALAIVLGLDAAQVPHFCNGQWKNGDPSGIVAAREWLKDMGLGIFTIPYPEGVSFSELMQSLKHCSPDNPVLVTGRGARGVNHVIVTIGGEVYCDPATGEPCDEEPLTGPSENEDGELYWWVEIVSFLPEAEA